MLQIALILSGLERNVCAVEIGSNDVDGGIIKIKTKELCSEIEVGLM